MQAMDVGKYLKDYPHPIDLIISSDAVRAKSTAMLVAHEIDYPADRIQFEEKIYSGTVRELIRLIEATPHSFKHILMIGHFPTIVELNNYLSGSIKESMETCELEVFLIEQDWALVMEGSGTCVLNYHPSH